MLIDGRQVRAQLDKHGISVSGVLHVGAHECEEMPFYNNILGIPASRVIWIDAIDEKIVEAKRRGIPNVYHGVVSNVDDETVVFNISNNGQSSSILELGTHKAHHPHVHYVRSVEKKTTTIDTFVQANNIDPSTLEFWNMDIQGAELKALQGGLQTLKYAKALYMEVNTEEVYVGCGLMSQMDEMLQPLGFERVLTDITRFKWGDALYIRKN
jgi:FkbM family methyltransferase